MPAAGAGRRQQGQARRGHAASTSIPAVGCGSLGVAPLRVLGCCRCSCSGVHCYHVVHVSCSLTETLCAIYSQNIRGAHASV
jgi:hypothetical protein